MRKALNQRGSFDPLLIPLVISVVLLVGIAGFGIWSYSNYLDAQKVEDAEIQEAVKKAEAVLTEDLEASFAQREKSPTRNYKSPASSGSVVLVYPKTWSVFSEESEARGTVNTFLHPEFVRAKNSDTAVALRMTVENRSYSQEVRRLEGQAEKGEVTISTLQVSGVTGIRADGIIDSKEHEGSLVMFPVRDKTLKIWTENTAFLGDFNDIMLKNLKFSP